MRKVTDDERRDRIGLRHALATVESGVEAAVRAVTCLHATEASSIYLSAYARSRADRMSISDALFSRRTVVRQLAMRRTVFAFPVDLLAAARGSASARVARQLTARLVKDAELAGIVDGPKWIADRCTEALQAIREEPGTTAQLRARLPELNTRVAAEGQPTVLAPVGSRVLSVLAASGSVVRGDNAGRWQASRPVWTAVEQWLGEDPGVLGEREGYQELVRRWLWSFGPGTEGDLVWWLGATKTAVRQALDDVGATPALLEDGTPAWLHPDDPEEVRLDSDWAALLPTLDPTTMGWRRRDFYLGDHGPQLFDGAGNAGPTAWWNGRIVGTWTQQPDGTVDVVPIEPLSPAAAAALEEEAAKLTAWFDGEVVATGYVPPIVRGRVSRGSA
ncbi:winged helix DNA-binding domain-containing protein [Amycolatopsis sp. AA4]|uniref:winged helix DNA-binding domain-containing protein n=1 Tax=Actinomycetes TaxID=1760 RepID=UPI0001B540B3|nr:MULTISPECIES: winged helix DNA-binding domain-containing protein [Actinomycetes]ATY14453.1 winged helix DNA-binding domain-containing protein [Amycolatopsis sp. AA4]